MGGGGATVVKAVEELGWPGGGGGGGAGRTCGGGLPRIAQVPPEGSTNRALAVLPLLACRCLPSATAFLSLSPFRPPSS